MRFSCFNPAWSISENGWIASSSALRRRLRIASPSLPSVTNDSNLWTCLSEEHDDQTLTDPDPVAHLVALHTAWELFAASTGGRGNVLSVHLKSVLYIVGIRVTYVTSLVAAFPDLKQTALQVVLQLAWALMKALCSESSSDLTTWFRCNVCICTLQDSIAPQSTSVRLLEVIFCICTFSAATRCLPPLNHRSIRPAVAQSFSHYLNRYRTT